MSCFLQHPDANLRSNIFSPFAKILESQFRREQKKAVKVAFKEEEQRQSKQMGPKTTVLKM